MRSGFDDWEDTLMSVLSGASLPAVKLAFWNTAREFYKRSRAWREQLGPFTLKAGRRMIALEPVDQNTSVCFLEGVHMPGVPIYMKVQNSPAFYVEGHVAEGTPARISLHDPHTAILTPAPSRDYEKALWLLVSVQPKRGAEALPPYASTHHFTALEEGTLGRLMMQVNRPWTDAATAAMKLRKFEVEIGRARAHAETEYGPVAGAWMYHNVPLR